MFRLSREISLPEEWEDVRIQSTAPFLNLDVGVELDPQKIEEAQDRLVSIRDEYGLDPDQIHRAMCEHEPFLALQEEDHHLRKVAFFRILAPWDPKTIDD